MKTLVTFHMGSRERRNFRMLLDTRHVEVQTTNMMDEVIWQTCQMSDREKSEAIERATDLLTRFVGNTLRGETIDGTQFHVEKHTYGALLVINLGELVLKATK